jgi:phytoene synthase
MDQYDINSLKISRITTRHYSTSFSFGVRLLDSSMRMPVYAIYGFVRVADEIVDTFHDHHQADMLKDFRMNTFEAIKQGISTNPILHSFQWMVNNYNIDQDLIHAFLDSMEMDLTDKEHTPESFKRYVYGSAEVVGLMCLRVFYKDDEQGFETMKYPAKKMGEAFQKINFLRDISSDFTDRGRFYFPGTNLETLTDDLKRSIEKDIQYDFDEAYKGIQKLNRGSRLGVLVSYTYYLKLFNKIRRTSAKNIFTRRYRIPNWRKLILLVSLWIRYQLRLA